MDDVWRVDCPWVDNHAKPCQFMLDKIHSLPCSYLHEWNDLDSLCISHWAHDVYLPKETLRCKNNSTTSWVQLDYLQLPRSLALPRGTLAQQLIPVSIKTVDVVNRIGQTSIPVPDHRPESTGNPPRI